MNMETESMDMVQQEQNVPEGYKRTEVGVIPEDWEVFELSQLVHIETGSTPSTSKREYYGNEFMFVSPADLGKTKWILESEKQLSKKGFAISRNFPPKSILVACIGSTIGKIGMAAIELTSNQQINAIFPNSSISNHFLYYFLSINAKKIKRKAAEQAVPILNKSKFGEINIPIPSLQEQKAIATALSDVDNLIESLDKLIAKKRAIKQATMQQLLSGKRRLPGFSGEWETKCLGEISEITGAGVDKKIKKEEQSVRLVNYLDVYNNNFITSDILNHWVTASNHKVKKCSVKKGDIFFTPSSEIQGDIGKSAVALEDIPDAAYSYHVVRVRLKEPLDIFFKTYAFKTDDFLNQAARQSEGSGTRYILNMSKFKQLTVLIPPFSEQTAIGKVLFDMDKEIQSLEQRRNKTKQIKQGMMQELLTGRTRLNLDFEGLKDSHDSKSGDQGNHKNHNSDKRNETSRTY